MGGGARCSRRHSPRGSKIVAAESRASHSAISIDDLAMSTTEIAEPNEPEPRRNALAHRRCLRRFPDIQSRQFNLLYRWSAFP